MFSFYFSRFIHNFVGFEINFICALLFDFPDLILFVFPNDRFELIHSLFEPILSL